MYKVYHVYRLCKKNKVYTMYEIFEVCEVLLPPPPPNPPVQLQMASSAFYWVDLQIASDSLLRDETEETWNALNSSATAKNLKACI